jgi:hypothetical protein
MNHERSCETCKHDGAEWSEHCRETGCWSMDREGFPGWEERAALDGGKGEDGND